MIITSKSALIYEHIMDKKNKGANYIEIHLTEPTLNNDIEKNVRIIKDSGIGISAIHSPLKAGYEIDDLINDENYKRIQRVFEFTNEIGKMLSRQILVVMHMDGSLETFQRHGVINIIASRIDKLLTEFSFTNIAIENSMLFKFNNTTENFTHARENHLYESVDMANFLNKTLNRDIGTVFDTCHAIGNVRLFNEFFKLGITNNLSLEYYFSKFKDTVKIVHLANSIGLGYGINAHAQPFETIEGKLLLSYMLGLINRINFNGYLTLEINEDDYTNSINWLKTKELVDNIIGMKGIL